MLNKPRIAAVFAAVLLLGIGVAWFMARQDASTAAGPSPRPAVRPIAKLPSPGPPAAAPANSAPPSVAAAPAPTLVPTPAIGESNRSSPAMPRAAVAPAAAATKPAPPNPVPPVADETPAAMIDIDKVSLMLRDYRTRMGSNPVGTNAEIMQSVMGGNPKGARLGPPEGQNLNGKGELMDRWGTPYFFHQMSATHMEIHSAGPDRLMGTEDDVIMR